MFCDNCGEELRVGSRFCSHCGYENKSLKKSVSINRGHEKASRGIESLKIWAASLKKRILHFIDCYCEEWKCIFAKKRTTSKCIIWCSAHIGGALIIICLIAVGIHNQTNNNQRRDNYSKEADNIDWEDSYSIDQKEDVNDEKDPYSELIDEGKEALSEAIDDVRYAKQVLFSSLQGKWMDKNGLFSITFNDDNTLTIKDASGVIGADLFTYTEVDDHTIALKADSDNILANIISLNMDYEVNGKVLTVSIAGMNYELERVK